MIKKSEDKLLLDRLGDLCKRCEKYSSPVFGSFLDEGELAVAKTGFSPPSDVTMILFGGYDGAARCLYGAFPEWIEPDFGDFPIKCLEISFNYGEKLSHRDYLGSILGLGLDRSKIGDIVVLDMGAYVFVCEEIADYIVSNLKKIGRRGVCCVLCEKDNFQIPEPEFEDISCVAASLRLDAVAAAMLGQSRSTTAKLIEDERVSLNHRACTDGKKLVVEADLISVRGYGRFVLSKIGAPTRSGRIHLTIKKYV